MSKTPQVSVITTFYNAELFLAEAIESVLSQRDFDDWELLLVDDGSLDHSDNVAQRYAAAIPGKIRLFHHQERRNLGISASRNLGIAHALGELIAFLDADDIWLPNKLRRQIQIMNDHPKVAMIYGAAERWFSWNESIAVENRLNNHIVHPLLLTSDGGGEGIIDSPSLLQTFLIDESQTPCTCTVMVRRKDVVSIGGFADSFRGLYDDQVFYAKLCFERSIYASSECWARYRQHEDSCCAVARRTNSTRIERSRFLQWLKRHIHQRPVVNSALVVIIDDELAKLDVSIASII
ncbi:MAG: glycosyltransferase family 2 protein [Acidobacteriota bacterium]|nr:glycosyltransferase family 2 protein [Acidobacteriota bacterium]